MTETLVSRMERDYVDDAVLMLGLFTMAVLTGGNARTELPAPRLVNSMAAINRYRMRSLEKRLPNVRETTQEAIDSRLEPYRTLPLFEDIHVQHGSTFLPNRPRGWQNRT